MKDQKIADLIKAEEQRQRDTLELIPSENHVSRQVLDALGSVFTDKYAEGYPGKRYYGGQQNTDQVETLAITRAKELFHADHANVQPHSGAPANLAVYEAWLEPGDTVLAMKLDHGGHLTHGHPVTSSAKRYNFVHYGIKDDDSGEIDYDELRALAQEHKPKIILAGFSGYPRSLDYQKFADIANESGAMLMADMAHLAGLIAAGVLPNPLDFGFHVMTTTTHKTLRGPRGGMILSKGTVGNPLKEVDKTLDNLPTLIDRQVFPGMQGGPHMNTIAAKAVALHEAGQLGFKDYAKQVLANAQALASTLKTSGFNLVSGGTDNHLIMINIPASIPGLDGRQAQDILDKVGLSTNCNAIPNDPLPPFKPSGLRIGTPAITSRGLKEADMTKIADWLKRALTNHQNQNQIEQIATEVRDFANNFPLPSDN